MNLSIRLFAPISLVLAISLGAISNLNAITSLEDTTTYVKIEVKGLSCPFCAYGLEKKLKKIDGVTAIKIDIKEGFTTFAIAKDKQPNEEHIRKVVKNAGFTAGAITFSDTPFTNKDGE